MEDVDSSPISKKHVVLPSTTEQKVFSFGQDLIYAVNNGRVLTPKHIALPLSVKNWTGSAEVVMTLNRFGHGISYTAIEELKTAMAEKQIQHPTSGCVPPSNIVHKVFSIFCYDNNDLQEETLSGKGTTHCTNGTVIQRQTHGCHLQPDEKEKKGSQKKRPFIASQIDTEGYVSGKQVGPQPVLLLEEDLKPQNAIFANFHKLDFGWLLSRLAFRADDIFKFSRSQQVIPSWIAFNATFVSSDDPPLPSVVGYSQVIDASPTDLSVVYTTLVKSLQMADQIGQKDVIVVFDYAIYAKAMEIVSQKNQELNRIVLRMGDFHTACNFLGIIGARFADAGLEDLLIESEVIAQGCITGVFEGKHYNRAVRAHKIVMEALWRLQWKSFGNWLREKEKSDVDFKKCMM